MGLNKIAIATVIALLGVAPAALCAETAPQPTGPAPALATPAAPAPSTDPALQASPITDAAPATPAAAPETAAPQTKGDTLTMPKKAPAAKKKRKAPSTPIRIEEDGMPGRGISMSQVEKHFGQPREKMAPVGNPPITRWVYGDYTVYFEHEYVIHSVRNEAAQPSEPAQPAATQQAPQPATPATMAAPAPTPSATQPAPAAEPAAPVTAPATPEPAAPASGQ